MFSKLTNLTVTVKSHYSVNDISKFLCNTHDIFLKDFSKYSNTFVSKFKSTEKECRS